MRFAELASFFALTAATDVTPSQHWWMTCDYNAADYSRMSRFPEYQGRITDKESCLTSRSRMFMKADLNDDFAIDQCEIVYGCLAAKPFDKDFDCLKYADSMPKITMGNLVEMCEQEWPGNPTQFLQSSTFLTDEESAEIAKLLPAGSKLAAAYIAEQDGWTEQDFSKQVEGKGPTLIVIKATTGKVLGGYTDIPWNRTEDGVHKMGNGNSFLFYFKDGRAQKLLHRQGAETYQDDYYFATFINSYYVYNNCNQYDYCSVKFKNGNYQMPDGTSTQQEAAQVVVGTDGDFKAANIETWLVK